MQGQKGRPSLYAGIVCENSSLAPPSGTPRASSPTIIIAAGDTFIPHSSLLTPHFLTKAISTSVLINVNFFRKYDII